MRRRAFLHAAGGIAALGGCAAPDVAIDSLSVSDRTMNPGAKATVTVEAPKITSLTARFTFDDGPPTRDPPIEFVFDEVTFSPAPDAVYQSLPPGYVWKEPRDVIATLPVRTFDDTPKGTYPFSVSVRKHGDEQNTTADSQVTVKRR